MIGAGATVGPFAYLRPGTYLGDRGKIGTFVETKNSTIGERSKVPHLSYIGDTTIGTGVNLGAGAITANYDDVAKHRTEIGDEVHSGSHNVFVAPVRIGARREDRGRSGHPQGCARRCSGTQRRPSAQRRGVGRDEPTGHGRG